MTLPVRLSRLAWFAIGYVASAGLQKLIGFIAFVWLARSLAVEEYARFGLLFALQTGVGAMAGAGISDSVVGLLRRSQAPAERTRLLAAANSVFLMLALASIVAAAAFYSFLYKGSSKSAAELILVLVGGVMSAHFSLQAMLVRLNEQHSESLCLASFSPLAAFVTALIAFWFYQDVNAFFGGLAGGFVIAFVVLHMVGIGRFRVATAYDDSSAIRDSIGPYIFIALLAWVTGYGNTYVAKLFFDDAVVAKFTFAYTLSSVLQLIATSTNQVWSPRFFRLSAALSVQHLEVRNRRFYLLQGIAIGGVGVTIMLSLPLFTALGGGNLPAYRNIGTELFVLSAAYAVSIPWWHAQNYFLVHGLGKKLLYVTIISSSIGVALSLSLMALWGPIGIYLGFLSQTLIRSAVSYWIARRDWQVELMWQGPCISLIMLAAALALTESLRVISAI